MSEDSIRKGRKVKWNLYNGSTVYVGAETRRNMKSIYDYLESKNKDVTRRFFPTINFLSKESGVSPKQVTYACMLMAMMEDKPLVRLHARSDQKGRVSTKIELLRRLKKNETTE